MFDVRAETISRNLIILAGVAVLAAGCSDSKTTPAGADEDTVVQAITSSDRYIVVFAPGAASAGRAAVEAKGRIVLEISGVEGVAAHLSLAAAEALSNNPNIKLIEKDPVRQPTADPAPDTVPYGVSMVQADQLDDGQTANRTVCIIDSGYDASHEDLPGGSNISGNDSLAGPWDEDGCGHGTHVAGTIAALGGNATGVVGINPGGTIGIHIERVFGSTCGWAYASELMDAANKCRDAGANVISMSMGCATGGPWCYSAAEDAVFQDLYDNDGILSVAAASNDGRNWESYPASYDSVISVAAVDSNEQHASFSNTNNAVELAAPGVGVLSTVPQGCWYCDNSTNKYEYWSGTSMATPHVSGVAALVWSYDPTLTNAQIRQALQNSAKDLGAAGRDRQTGFGLVQAQAALDYLGLGAPQCTTDADCDDGNECTADTCTAQMCSNTPVADDTTCGGGAGICCAGGCGAPACSSDAECDDAVACTLDSCSAPATCGATCSNEPTSTCGPSAVCGNGICEEGEDGLTCSADCRCAGGKTCRNGNCGDGVCDGSENTHNCLLDCG
jgi:serine protease